MMHVLQGFSLPAYQKREGLGPCIGFKKKILARLEGGIRVRRTGQYVVEGSDR
jgi:hypothetical protein